MSALAEKRLNVDEFLAWADGREGKWELHDGVPVAMSPERVRDTVAKSDAAFALSTALDRAGVPCRAYAKGITVRISKNRALFRTYSSSTPRCSPTTERFQIRSSSSSRFLVPLNIMASSSKVTSRFRAWRTT